MYVFLSWHASSATSSLRITRISLRVLRIIRWILYYWNTVKVNCLLIVEHKSFGMLMWIGCTFMYGSIATIGSLYASVLWLGISRCLIAGVEKESRKWKLSRILFLGLSRSFSHWQYIIISPSLHSLCPMYLWVVLTDLIVIVVCIL